MTLIEKLKQIERVDALIRKKATGSPASLASRLEVSERYIYNLIGLMKEMGGPIAFCHIRNSYYYQKDVVFSIGFLTKENLTKKINGGKSNFLLPLHDLCSKRIYF